MRTCRMVDFAISTGHRVKLKESKKRDNYLDLAGELKNIMEHESDDDTNCNWDKFLPFKPSDFSEN